DVGRRRAGCIFLEPLGRLPAATFLGPDAPVCAVLGGLPVLVSEPLPGAGHTATAVLLPRLRVLPGDDGSPDAVAQRGIRVQFVPFLLGSRALGAAVGRVQGPEKLLEGVSGRGVASPSRARSPLGGRGGLSGLKVAGHGRPWCSRATSPSPRE